MKPLTTFPALFLALTGCTRPAPEPFNSPRIIEAPTPFAASPRMADIAITRANFSSLKFDTNLGTTKSKTCARMRVENGCLTVLTRERRKHMAPFSRAEFDELLKILNTAKFPALSGSYRQQKLYDSIYQTATLTLRGQGKSGKPLVFTVDNYGNHAPPAYKNVSRFLFGLRERKFPSVAFEYLSG